MNHISLSFSKQASHSPSNLPSHSPPKQPAPSARRPTDLSNLLTTPRTPQPLDPDGGWPIQADAPDNTPTTASEPLAARSVSPPQTRSGAGAPTPMQTLQLVSRIENGLNDIQGCLSDPHCPLWRMQALHQQMDEALRALMAREKTAEHWIRTRQLLTRFKQQCERAQHRYPHTFATIEQAAWRQAYATYCPADVRGLLARRPVLNAQALMPLPSARPPLKRRLSDPIEPFAPCQAPHPEGFDTASQMQALAFRLKRALEDNTQVDQAVLALRQFQTEHPQAPVAGWIVQLQWSAFDRLAERWPTPLPF